MNLDNSEQESMMRGRKRKNGKGPIMDGRKNIFAWHNEKIAQFDNEKKILPQYRQRCETLKKEIQQLEKNFDTIEKEQRIKLFKYKEELQEKERLIHTISSGMEEMKYIADALPLLMRYEELKKEEEMKDDTEKIEDDGEQIVEKKLTNNFGSFVTRKNDLEINKVINEYLSLVDPNHVNTYLDVDIFQERFSKCPVCTDSLCVVGTECDIVCTECGLVVGSAALDSSNISFKQSQEMDTSSQYKYEKINHFRDKLAQLQGKENTTIPEEDLETIKKEVSRYKISHVKHIDKEFIRHILKKCKLNKKKNYNEHAAHIIQLLGGEKPEQMTPQMEQTLESMFLRTLEPWAKYKPKERKNYNAYEYTIFKLCQLKGWDKFLCNLKLPKSKDIRQSHDENWRKICNDLGWQFIDTIGS